MLSTVPAGIQQDTRGDGGNITQPTSQQTSMERVAERKIETDREHTQQEESKLLTSPDRVLVMNVAGDKDMFSADF